MIASAAMVQEFLSNGGKIKRYRSRADEIAAMVIPGKRFNWPDKYKKLWNTLHPCQSPKTPSVRSRRPATAPGGGIEPGLPNNPRSNPKKTIIRRPAALSGVEIRWERG